ncbi:GGDEF domain-containing protein [Thiorhodococcus minor]|uniref:diguanylate cyclase n=2 Tax=Thiorhodococcus minor TaxID=57489 RepID=A0A6M0K2E7_9GAMM|nr:GGDEF domain-containing protein [Thiorhodococcus minor]
MLVIDTDYRVIAVNRYAVELTGLGAPGALMGKTCFGALVSRTAPCDQCPIERGRPLASIEHSLKVVTAGKAIRYLKEGFTPWGKAVALTFSDVTREILALQKADRARKEALAKKMLLERLRKEDAAEKAKISGLLDALPDALLTIDRNYRIVHMNSAARNMLPDVGFSTCYEALRRREPCASCPAEGVFTLTESLKVTHLVDGDYYTESITPVDDSNGAAILLRNTTREIQLIEKIREQQKTIAKSNEILASLVRLGGAMRTEEDPEPVTHLFLDLFLSACGATSAALVVFDKRASSVWFSAQRGFDDSTMHELIKTCLSERRSRRLEQGFRSEAPTRSAIVGLPIRGSDEQQVGYAFWVEPEDPVDGQLVSLFLEPFGAFIHSQLLMRLLQEKANTDPLTGAYNRGYLSNALEEERAKYALYEIPYAIVVADVNGLKQVNDQHGHEAGDKVIIAVAAQLGAAIRATDVLARTGGDEFVVLLTNAGQADAESFLARLRQNVLPGISVDLAEGVTWPVTLSMGACGVDEAPPADLTKIADERMYEAKSKHYAAEARYR